MCGRFAQTRSVEELESRLEATADPAEAAQNARVHYNAAPGVLHPVARVEEDGARHLRWLSWGLVLPPRTPGERPLRRINARSETALTAPSWRDAMRWHRCLVPCDGFYEWRRVGKQKQPYFVRLPGDGVSAMGGLYMPASPQPDAPMAFGVLTVDATGWLDDIHDRMPLFVPPAAFADWLDPATSRDRVQALLAARPDGPLVVTPVSERVNSVANDDPACLLPPAQSSLF